MCPISHTGGGGGGATLGSKKKKETLRDAVFLLPRLTCRMPPETPSVLGPMLIQRGRMSGLRVQENRVLEVVRRILRVQLDLVPRSDGRMRVQWTFASLAERATTKN